MKQLQIVLEWAILVMLIAMAMIAISWAYGGDQ